MIMFSFFVSSVYSLYHWFSLESVNKMVGVTNLVTYFTTDVIIQFILKLISVSLC